MLSLIILRGLPGAGKTKLAKLLSENNKWPVFSIDSYFTDPLTNEYNFQFDKNHLAYKNCEDQTKSAMENKTEKIFIDNVFSLDWEIEPYFKFSFINQFIGFFIFLFPIAIYISALTF